VQTIRFESSLNQSSDAPEEKACFQLHNRYIVRQVKSGMMIVDQQAAHERILFEKYSNQVKNKTSQSQQSLFPQTITFNAADFALVLELQREIEDLGFRIEVFGKNTILVNGVPANISGSKEKELFEGLMEQVRTIGPCRGKSYPCPGKACLN
jgi:DNA mismatch repair protein MutL